MKRLLLDPDMQMSAVLVLAAVLVLVWAYVHPGM